MRRDAAVPRRGFLAAGIALVAVCCGWDTRDVRSHGPVTSGWSSRRVLDAVLPNLASAQVIGEAYLRAGRAGEASAERLMALIFAGQSPAAVTGAEFRAFIGHRLQRDFADGAVVKVDGWMLSVTEARLCALAVVAAG